MRDLCIEARKRHSRRFSNVGVDGNEPARRHAKSVEKGGSQLSKTQHGNHQNTDGDGGGVLSTARSNN